MANYSGWYRKKRLLKPSLSSLDNPRKEIGRSSGTGEEKPSISLSRDENRLLLVGLKVPEKRPLIDRVMRSTTTSLIGPVGRLAGKRRGSLKEQRASGHSSLGKKIIPGHITFPTIVQKKKTQHAEVNIQ